MTDWTQLIQTFGLAVVMLGVITWGAIRIANFVAREMILPGRDLFFVTVKGILLEVKETVVHLDQKLLDEKNLLDHRTEMFKEIIDSQHDILRRLECLERAFEEVRGRKPST